VRSSLETRGALPEVDLVDEAPLALATRPMDLPELAWPSTVDDTSLAPGVAGPSDPAETDGAYEPPEVGRYEPVDAGGLLDDDAATSLYDELGPPAESVATARVSTPGFDGVFLRTEPSGSIIRLLAQGTVVELLEVRAFAGGIQWQQVRAPDGTIGWAASQALI
jgi:hypothetical protein